MTVYYVQSYQHEINDDSSWLTGQKDITLYMIQEGKLQAIGDLCIKNEDNTLYHIGDYFGDFFTQIQLIEL
jgi:hypothetical protein